MAHTGGGTRILSPTDGSVIALDPDIAPGHQRLLLQAQGQDRAKGLRWRLSGQDLGRGSAQFWNPLPGRHRIELLDARNGAVLDQVQIEVRGATLRPPKKGV